MNMVVVLTQLARWAPSLAFGVAVLYWQGYVYLRGYFNVNDIDPSLTDLTFQDILTTGVWSIIIFLMSIFEWLLQLLLIFIKPPWIPLNVFTVPIVMVCAGLLVPVVIYGAFKAFLKLWSVSKNSMLGKFEFIVTILFITLIGIPLFTAHVIPNGGPIVSRLISSHFSYSAFTVQPRVHVSYTEPAIKSAYIATYSQDLERENFRLEISCDKNLRCLVSKMFDECVDGVCGGTYDKIFETRDQLFLRPAGWDCNVFPSEVSRLAQKDRNIDYPKWDCKTIALPKNRVLSIFRL